ncbi:MAG: AraC family transcriptional regulator ligand-binding domain-containing protein [Pseudomonadales bacterium]
MAQISALFVVKMIDQADASIDADALYHAIGLDRATAAEPGRMVAEADYYRLLETLAAHERPDVRFHVNAAATTTCEQLGAVGFAMKSAPILRASFSRLHRYTRLFNTASKFWLEETGDGARWLHHRSQPARDGMYLSNEGALVTFVTLCREVNAPDFVPSAVQYRHQPVGSVAALEAYYRCPVTFGADVDALAFTAEQLDAPNAVGDESIWRFFSTHLEQTLARLDEESAIDGQVVLKIADTLSDGTPTIGTIASQLGMSARTLQRRLAERGRTFQALVEDARRHLAEQLLSSTRYSLAEVAFLTGFSEQSAFTRAFKRWAGETPRAYRMSRQPGH